MKQLFLLLFAFTSLTFAGGIHRRQCHPDTLSADYKTSYGGIGASYSDLNKLNNSLKQNNFARMDQGVFLITGGEQFHYNRIIVGGDMTGYLWNIAESGSRRNFQAALDITALGGFDLIANEQMALFPFVGLGIGTIVHHMAYEGIHFDEIAQSSKRFDETIWQPVFLVKTGVGFDFELPHNKQSTTIGIRAGYTFDISDEDRWYRELSTISGAPGQKLSGPFVKVVLGVKSKE